MRRRDILASAGSLATGATLGFPAPAIAQKIRKLKLVTDLKKNGGIESIDVAKEKPAAKRS